MATQKRCTKRGSRVHRIGPVAEMNLEMQVRPRGLRVSGVTHVSDYLASSYARPSAEARSVRQIRIAEVVRGPRVVVVQMVVEVLVAVVSPQQDRIALAVSRPHFRDPVDSPV